jgi:hypothetical protein
VFNRVTSPYLKSEQRLGDVIAAIQAMGIYKFHLCEFKTWARHISGDENQDIHWKNVFQQHPEFFRLDPKRQKAGLVLRAHKLMRYNTDDGELIDIGTYEHLPDEDKKKISREPLTPDQIGTLIDVAIKMHTRACELARDKRWWFSPLLVFLGALLGATIPTVLKDKTDKPATAQLSTSSASAVRISH